MEEPLTLPPPPLSARDRKTRRALILLGVLAACVVVAAVYWRYAGQVETSSRARVEGRTFSIPAAASARVVAVAVSEGQEVRQGELLFRLDDVPLQSALAEARAALETVKRGGVVSGASSPASREAEESASRLADQARTEEGAARQHVEHWTAEHARSMVVLRSPHGTSGAQREQAIKDEGRTRAALDDARGKMEEASRRRAGADAELRRVRDSARLDRPGPEQPAVWQARVNQAEADLAGATALAPLNGRVVWLAAHEGQSVSRGEPLLVLAPTADAPGDELWVTAAFGRTQMLSLRVGQSCRVHIEDGPVFDGVITALLPEQGGGIARIALLDVPPDAPVYPGLSAEVDVRIR